MIPFTAKKCHQMPFADMPFLKISSVFYSMKKEPVTWLSFSNECPLAGTDSDLQIYYSIKKRPPSSRRSEQLDRNVGNAGNQLFSLIGECVSVLGNFPFYCHSQMIYDFVLVLITNLLQLVNTCVFVNHEIDNGI